MDRVAPGALSAFQVSAALAACHSLIVVRDEGIPCPVPDVENRDCPIGLVDCVDDPMDVPAAPIQQVTQAGILGDGWIARRMLIQVQDRAFKPGEPCGPGPNPWR